MIELGQDVDYDSIIQQAEENINPTILDQVILDNPDITPAIFLTGLRIFIGGKRD
jgi:hypothetical protein